MLDLQIMLYVTGLAVSLVGGMLGGRLLRGRMSLSFGKATLGVIVLLIFSLGFGIGSNRKLMDSLPQVGLNAIVIAFMTIAFSVVLVIAVKKLAGLK